jgi:Protein of unknown function (DUF1553)/Protein of unknown function (DUF1549)
MHRPLAALSLLLLGLPAPAADPAPTRLEIHPGRLDLSGPHDRQRLLVTAHFADGTRRDVTRAATFATDQARVANIVGGECHAAGHGGTDVTASFAGLTASVPVSVGSEAGGPPSFVNDVVPLLTRLGCNAGSCHGKGTGQNGFRLSLRGYAPELDHRWLTREFGGRRVADTAADSLMLHKALALVPHAGGRVVTKDSRANRQLRDWVDAGAPGPAAADAPARRLVLLPGPRTMKVGDEQQLLARAEFAPGEWRDVTWLTRFDSNDAGVVSVTPGGLVTALRAGETAVRAAFQGEVAAVVFTVPFEQAVSADKFTARHNVIDDHVFAKLAALRVEPSEPSDDAEFCRRAFLDAIGTLPTPAEVRRFLADRGSDKRARLVDELLERPEFVDYWTLFLGDLFQNRRERDRDVRGTKGVRSFHTWLRAQVAANRPWDELAREVLTATGSTADHPAVGYFVVTVGEAREADKSELTDSVAQAFLGTRIGCAKCHNHPLERYTQDDYYHFAAFFTRIKLDRPRGPQMGEATSGPPTLHVASPNPRLNGEPVGVRQPRTGEFLVPRPIDRAPTPVRPTDDPRARLAAWMTDPRNEYFAGAMVNRVWKHFLGVGLVEPVDDLRQTNPPSNPELWNALVREFVGHKYDLKHLIRLILNSRTYQLSSATKPTNVADTRFSSHYVARRLPAEVLLDAISQATGLPDAFPGYPVGARAIQLPDPGLRSYFLDLFGRSERLTACACERSGDVTVPQLLHLQNGESIQRRLQSADGRLGRLLAAKASDDAITDELFLATLSRPPSEVERSKVRAALADDSDRVAVFRDLFWALVNAKEFAFNH